MKIWKQVLAVVDTQEIEVPKGARLLTAREQNNQPCVWFMCDPDAPKTKRTIYICGTGHEAPDWHETNYLGTAITHGGGLVWHIFEKL